MQLKIWGCRGSLATPGDATRRYGGNTSCVEVRSQADSLVVLDAGTGIRSLGLELERAHRMRIDILLTHLHLDHVEGLGLFAPLFDEATTVRIWGPRPDHRSLREHLAAYLSPPLFPIPFERIPARVEVAEVGDESWMLDGMTVTAAAVQHPGRTLAYRIEEGGAALAYVPDNEPALNRASGLALAADADLLLHDAQYTHEEYVRRVGWGHTGTLDFARFVLDARARRTLMFHHDPAHSDELLEEMEASVHQLASDCLIELARENLELSIS